MTSALVVEGAARGSVDLAADLAAVGIRVCGTTTREHLVRDAAQATPDVVVCHEVWPDDALFAAFALLAETDPRPVAVFTDDPDVAHIDRATEAGVHAYVVNGYDAQRLRAVIHVAQARFAHESRLRGALAAVTRRFDERKLVDRAKGILMRARQVSEDEAFGVLRAASMHSNRRVGQVSQQVIAAAHYAAAVNRAGKVRMLSQRLVKVCALRLIDPGFAAHAEQFDDSVRQIDAHIEALGKSLSKPTFGDLLDAVVSAWSDVQRLSASLLVDGRLGEIDAAAELLLQHAEQLTRQLEIAGLVTTLHVINVSGRQRMLSQRHAKQALLGLALTGDRAQLAQVELAKTAATFEAALGELRSMPLTTSEIRAELKEAERIWAGVTTAARQAQLTRNAAGARALDRASEALVGLFEQLTDRYERSMQVLMG